MKKQKQKTILLFLLIPVLELLIFNVYPLLRVLIIAIQRNRTKV